MAPLGGLATERGPYQLRQRHTRDCFVIGGALGWPALRQGGGPKVPVKAKASTVANRLVVLIANIPGKSGQVVHHYERHAIESYCWPDGTQITGFPQASIPTHPSIR